MTLVLLAIPLGLATGALLGLLGAGGSVLTVPALVYLLDQPVGPATTAALAIVAANAAIGAAENARRGTLDVGLAIRFGAASMLGALLGSYLNHLSSGTTVLFLLSLVMIGSASSLWHGRPEGARRPPAHGLTRLALVASLGFVVGVLTGFFGVGGGFLIVPALILLLDVPVRVAIGTSLAIITITAVAGLGGHLAQGAISWPITLSFGAAGLAGTWFGTRSSSRVGSESLARGFAVMLIAVALLLLLKNGSAIAWARS